MESPRKKLGSNLGPAPAFSVFTTPPAPTAPEQQEEGAPAAGTPGPDRELATDAQGEAPAAPPPALVAPPPSATPRSTAKLPAKAPARPPARLSPQQVQPAATAAAARRLHGTFSEPYQRKTGDRAQTRQTTLTVDLELDDRFESFFRRNRATYRTRSALWAAAMAYFLDAHRG